jgi:hypothetical protein
VKKVKILAILFSLLLVGCLAPVRSSKPYPEQTGFRNIKWGTEISALTGMEKVEEGKSSNSDLVWYTRKGDTLAIGKAKLRNIFFSLPTIYRIIQPSWMNNEFLTLDDKMVDPEVFYAMIFQRMMNEVKKSLFRLFAKVDLRRITMSLNMPLWGIKGDGSLAYVERKLLDS